jgi:hypothetical protein
MVKGNSAAIQDYGVLTDVPLSLCVGYISNARVVYRSCKVSLNPAVLWNSRVNLHAYQCSLRADLLRFFIPKIRASFLPITWLITC